MGLKSLFFSYCNKRRFYIRKAWRRSQTRLIYVSDLLLSTSVAFIVFNQGKIIGK